MTDRYPLSPVPGDPHRVVVEFRNRGARATFKYDPRTGKTRRESIQVDSGALDISRIEYVGIGPLQNAMDRATSYFQADYTKQRSSVPTSQH